MARARFAFTPEQVALIGKVSDARVAREAGCARLTVVAYRKRAGIPPPPRDYKQQARARAATVPYARFLGLVPDYEVAETCGVSRQAVGYARKRRHLEPYPLATMRAWQMFFVVLDSAEVGATKVSIPRSVYDDLVAASLQKPLS